MSENLALNLTKTAEAQPDAVALKLDDAEMTYAMLDEGSARVAGLLKAKGVEPGDRVGVMLPNVPHFAVAYYGVLRAGGVVVPMNVLLKGREVGFYLSDPGAKVLFAWHDFGEAAQRGADEAGDVDVVLVEPGEFEQLLGRAGARPRRGRSRRRRHRGHPVHVGHDRPAQGRRAHARQSGAQRRGGHEPVRHRGRRRRVRWPAAVPLLRPDMRAERVRARAAERSP